MIANHGFRIRRLSDSHTKLSTITRTTRGGKRLYGGLNPYDPRAVTHLLI